MAIAAAASRGDLASAKAVWQPVSKERGEGRQNKPAGGSVLHVSCRLGMEILESILGSISTSVHQLSLRKLKTQCKTCRSFKVIFFVS